MDRLALWLSRLFGWSFLFLSGFVALETLLRKIFNISLQGADELGGYVLAAGASLAFVVAMIERAHIRIDVVHTRLPLRVQAALDWLSMLSLAVLGFFFLYVGWFVVADTVRYGSTRGNTLANAADLAASDLVRRARRLRSVRLRAGAAGNTVLSRRPPPASGRRVQSQEHR